MLLHKSWSLAAGSALAVALGLTVPTGVDLRPDSLGMQLGKVTLQSPTELAFGPSNILFVADGRANRIYALDLPERDKATLRGSWMMVPDLDLKVAGLLGTTRDNVRFGDMARHPESGALYLTVSRASSTGNASALLRVSSRESIELVNLDQVRHSSAPIPSALSSDAPRIYGQPAWSYTVTDMEFVGDELWVSGLSNEQFSSALRRIPFPFSQTSKVATVEVFHTAHGRWETASPIEVLLPVTLNGVPSLIAAYTCTPLAVFAQEELRAGGHRRGRTIAELGGGTVPTDMIQFQYGGKDYLLVATLSRAMMRIELTDVLKAEEMTTMVDRTVGTGTAGVPYRTVSSSGLMQLADLDADWVATLVRDSETGSVNLQAYNKRWM